MDIADASVTVTVCKLAMLSLMEVFKDVLPDYRIRVFTNTEKRQKVFYLCLCFHKLNVDITAASKYRIYYYSHIIIRLHSWVGFEDSIFEAKATCL